MTAFYGSGATPPMRHGSPFARARSPLVPLCAAPCVCATAPVASRQGTGAMWVPRVIPRSWATFSGMREARDWSRSASLAPCVAAHHARVRCPTWGSGWAGVIFGHCEKIWVFPSFGNSFGVPHPGILCLSCARSRMRPWLPVNRPDGSSALDPLMDVLHMQCVSSRKTTSLRAIIV